MSDTIRAKLAGVEYFFTLVTFDRRPFLTSPVARRILRTTWQEVQGRYPFAVRAVCLLPDHIHCIWKLPEQDNNFSKRWMSIKAIFTKRFLAAGGSEGRRNQSRKRTGEAAVWQRRFWQHMIRDEDDFRRHFHYIHYNPVQHGYVNRPHDWNWSSYHRYRKLGYYQKDWGSAEPHSFGNGGFGE